MISHSDPNHLLIPMCLLVPIKQGRPVTIPCRLTHPHATVNLVKEPDTEMPLDDGLTYNPRTGFHIIFPTSAFNGLFRCDATLGNKTDSLEVGLMFKRKY